MNRFIGSLLAVAFAASIAPAAFAASATKCPAGETYTKAYTKADGTKVAGYCSSHGSKATPAAMATAAAKAMATAKAAPAMAPAKAMATAKAAPASMATAASKAASSTKSAAGATTCPAGKTYVNGYTKYASNGVDRIDFITTEHHPRDFNNSIYHGFIQSGKLHRSDGTVVDQDIFHSAGHPQTELTHVFSANSMFDGEIMTYAWTISLEVDASGNPYGLISARANVQPENSNVQDHRFFYIRFDGKSWNVNQLARAGACLWPAEEDYTGLAALDPSDPNVVYVSTTIDPRNDSPLRAHEIFQGRTSDSGRTWQWTAITSDSSVDNLRPLAVSDGDQTVLVWFRGTMSRSQHYDSAMVGLIFGKPGDVEKVEYLPGQSAIPNLPEGQYNIYIYFWSDPRQDNRISAGLTPESIAVFRPRACQAAESSQFTQATKVAEGNRLLYRAFLGRIKIDSPRSLAISVQDQDSASFAGVGYQPIE